MHVQKAFYSNISKRGSSLKSLSRSLLFTALFPAFTVEQFTIWAFPWEFFVTDPHVVWFWSLLPMLMFYQCQILEYTKYTDRSCHKDGQFDPFPHFSNFFSMGDVVSGLDLLLSCNTSFELCGSFLLHLLFGSEARNGLCRTALGCSPNSSPCDGTSCCKL